MSFANCSVIKPPADLQALCPDRQRGVPVRPAALRPQPKVYLWDHLAWQWQPPSTAFVPDTAAFTTAKNARALRFAERAVLAQPLAYAFVVAQDSVRPLVASDTFPFPVTQPTPAGQPPANYRYELGAVRSYVGTTAGIGPYLGHHLGARLQQPFARLVRVYQQLIFLPGPVFALILVVGLVGIMARRRHAAVAALLWLSAVITIVLPVAEHEYTYRYVVPAIPLACMAAALAFAARPAASTPGSGTPGSGTPGSGTPGSGTPGSGTPGPGAAGPGAAGPGAQAAAGPQPAPESEN
jgi:hypothetical protein